MDIATVNAVMSEAVGRFCAKHELTAPLESAIRLAETVFAPVNQLRVDVETDPETDDSTVVIGVTVVMGVEEAVRRKREFTRRWVEISSPAMRERVRLVYDLVPQ